MLGQFSATGPGKLSARQNLHRLGHSPRTFRDLAVCQARASRPHGIQSASVEHAYQLEWRSAKDVGFQVGAYGSVMFGWAFLHAVYRPLSPLWPPRSPRQTQQVLGRNLANDLLGFAIYQAHDRPLSPAVQLESQLGILTEHFDLFMAFTAG